MKPVVQALLLAERIWRAENEGYIIAGTFTGMIVVRKKKYEKVDDGNGNTVDVVSSGARSSAPWVYVSLTDVCEDTELSIQFTCLKKNATLFSSPPIRVEGASRLDTVQMALQLPDLSDFIRGHDEGAYVVEAICEGEIIGSYRIKTRFQDTDDTGFEGEKA